MTEMELLIDLHRQQARQGPGSDAQTRLMMSLAVGVWYGGILGAACH